MNYKLIFSLFFFIPFLFAQAKEDLDSKKKTISSINNISYSEDTNIVKALNDTLRDIRNKIYDQIIFYNKINDLKRNLLKVELSKSNMTFVFHTLKTNKPFFRFSDNKISKKSRLNNLDKGETVKVFPERISTSDGNQYILVQALTSQFVRSDDYIFLNYKNIKNELPDKFKQLISSESFISNEQIKIANDRLNSGLSENDFNRWMQVTLDAYERKTIAKSIKKKNYEIFSEIADSIIMFLFVIRLL